MSEPLAKHQGENAELAQFARLAPRPKHLDETGIPQRVLETLLLKHLSTASDLDIATLSDRLALTGNLVELLLQKLKTEALVEIRSNGRFDKQLRYGLTHKGMDYAKREREIDGYLGPAPIPLEQYQHLVKRQTGRLEFISKQKLSRALADLEINEHILNQVGPAVNSGRAIFIYGRAGTGKTYLSRRLVRIFSSKVLIPYAVCVGHQVIQLFDPLIHQSVDLSPSTSLRLDEGHDQRLQICKRPEVVVGGELTTDMLEIRYDPARRVNQAPLQMKANNGILLLDDLGRQQCSVDAILNRWIVPLEEKRDFLALSSGAHFEMPFEQILIFSTNLNPEDLADEAFLRRIGYKIEFHPMDEAAYRRLWKKECENYEVECPEGILAYVIMMLHRRYDVPFLPCHPRDLISMSRNQLEFEEQPPVLNERVLEQIWHSYFVNEQPHQNTKGGHHGH